jgi:high affinity Mn2+ porin
MHLNPAASATAPVLAAREPAKAAGARRARRSLSLLLLVPSAFALANVGEPNGVQAEEHAPGGPGESKPPQDSAAPVVATAATPNATSGVDRIELERAPASIQRPPTVPGPAGEVRDASPWWSAGFQSTYVLQRKGGFGAPYTGPNSLSTNAETGYTLTATAYLGVRPWAGAELFFNPESIQSQSLSHLSGLGGLSNGENQKGGGPTPMVYRARIFMRHTIALGGESSTAEPGSNQFGGLVASRRLVVTAGNFSWADVFDGNAFAHDARTQFLDWALMSYGAADYAADVRGYTTGFAVEYYHDDWAFRLGRFAQPIESNGLALDFDLLRHYGDTIEIERGHTLFGLAGKVRVAGIHNFARMGSFRDALRYAAANGGVPDVGNVRRDQSKYGFGLSLEQNVLPDLGLFARLSLNDGRTETYTFAEIERSVAAGLSMKGRRWWRESDTLAVAWVVNALSDAHRDYVGAGGLGFLIGDGRLDRYRSEQILEAYYSFNAFHGFWVSLDAQRIVNPAYNPDRGPVNIVGLRFHVEY